MRYRTILALADGESSNAITQRSQSSAQTVSKWRHRYIAQGIAGLSDALRSGRPRTLLDESVKSGGDQVVGMLAEIPIRRRSIFSILGFLQRLPMPENLEH